MTQDELTRNIDIVLSEMFKDTSQTTEGRIKYKFNGVPLVDEMIQSMAVLGIINLTDKAVGGQQIIVLTNFGHEVMRHGGWAKYLADKDEEKRLSTELIKSSIRTNNLQKTLLWATVIFTFLTLVISTADFLAHDEEEAIQLKMLQLQESESQHPQQNIKTADPNPDSSRISKIDSLDKNLKVKK